MKDRMEWIEQLNEKKLAELTPQIGKHFISPSREKDEKMYERIEEISEKRVDFPFTFTRIIKYAAAVLILIGAGIIATFFLTRSGELKCFHMIINGDVVVRKGRESGPLEIHQPVVKGNDKFPLFHHLYIYRLTGKFRWCSIPEHTD